MQIAPPITASSANPSGIEIHNDTGVYELQAVITHQGRYADGGHYVAWVKVKDDWLLFDDDSVSLSNWVTVQKASGGADWHNAYLLLYKTKLAS
jgi:ubiquitin carboxyl-terminal hydrolase 14